MNVAATGSTRSRRAPGATTTSPPIGRGSSHRPPLPQRQGHPPAVARPTPSRPWPTSGSPSTRVTLHELPDNVYELFRIRDSLTQKIDAATDNPSRARLLGLRAVAGRIPR